MQIEDGIPIPSPQQGNNKYPVRELSVGQSFFIEESDVRKRQNLVRSILKAARGAKVSVTTRILSNGVRTWRIE
jgi:hypothetical protein